MQKSGNESRSLPSSAEGLGVVTLKIYVSMHDAKARVHRPIVGHYWRVDPMRDIRLENTKKAETNAKGK